MNFKAVFPLPKTARSAQTHKSISFIWIVWSTLRLVSSMPFRFPFHLPVLFYNNYFSPANMLTSCWPIHFKIISPIFQKDLIRYVLIKREKLVLLLSLLKYMQTFYAIWKQRNQLPNNSIDFVAFQKGIIKVMYIHTYNIFSWNHTYSLHSNLAIIHAV